eukprot:m.310469 g.310469  ORF g.310469 m.310469 type:complete len:1050 (+) comp51829_c0_seq1:71-3220(+)
MEELVPADSATSSEANTNTDVSLGCFSEEDIAGAIGALVDKSRNWLLFASYLDILEEAGPLSADDYVDSGNLPSILARRLKLKNVPLLKAATWAFLLPTEGHEQAAFNLLQLHLKSESEDALRELIKNRLEVPEALSKMRYHVLHRAFQLPCPEAATWHQIFERVGLKAIDVDLSDSHGLCKAAIQWDKEGRRIGQLTEVLFDVGHLAFVRELILEQKELKSLEEDQGLKGSEVNVEPSAKTPKLFHVPPIVSDLTGRDEDLETLKRMLEETGNIAICGLSGMGKTTLAANLVHQVKMRYDYVWYITCSSEEGFQESISKMGREAPWLSAYDRSNEGSKQAGIYFKESFESCKDWLYHIGPLERLLVVFDALNDLAPKTPTKMNTVEKFLEKELPPNVHCLFTSRKALTGVGGVKIKSPFSLRKLYEDDVVSLLKRHCRQYPHGKLNRADERALKNIAVQIGGIPLLVNLVANCIKRKNATFQDYYKWILEHELVVSDDEENQRAVFLETIRLAAETDAEKELLSVMAFCEGGHPVPKALFTDGASKLDSSCSLGQYVHAIHSRHGPGVSQVIHGLLTKLEHHHLIYNDPECERPAVAMHLEVGRQVLKNNLGGSERHLLGILSCLLKAAFEKVTSYDPPYYEALFPHAAKLLTAFDENVVDPYLMLYFGRVKSDMGHFLDGKKLLTKALNRAETEENLMHSKFQPMALQFLGECHRQIGELQLAETRLAKAVASWERRIQDAGDRRREELERNSAIAKMYYARVFIDAGDYQQGLDHLKSLQNFVESESSSVPCSSRRFGSSKGDIYSAMGLAHFGLDHFKRAKEFFEKACGGDEPVDDYKLALGKLWAYIAEFRVLLQASHTDHLLVEKLCVSCQEALRSLEHQHGSTHRYVVWMWSQMAEVEMLASPFRTSRSCSGLKTALDLAHQSLKGHLTLYKSIHPKIAAVCEVVADVCLKICEDGVPCSDAIQCAEIALKKAVNILTKLMDDSGSDVKFGAVQQKIKAIKEKQDIVDVWNRKQSYTGKQADGNKSFPETLEDDLQSIQLEW